MKHLFESLLKKIGLNTPTSPEPPSTMAANSAEKDEESRFRNDRPITKKGEDIFGRWSFAERIAETLVNRRDSSSLVVGLYGPWGDGKTSTLRLMETALAGRSHVTVVNFNPWYFDTERELIRGFFTTLADALGKSLPTRKEELGQILKRYGSILSVVSVTIGGALQLSPGVAAQGVGEALSTVELDELRVRLERILRDSGARIVVMIDDIDRLDRSETHSIFKLVKLSAGFEGISYVLAFDDDVVAAALGERYGAGNHAAGKRFLEKIVQVPLRLPSPDTLALRRLCFNGVEEALKLSGIELTNEQVNAFIRHFVDGLESRLTTPRQAKLYINALLFALPTLKGEVHTVDRMLIEGIRVFYPTLYASIRENMDEFIGSGSERGNNDGQSRANQIVDDALKLDGIEERDRIRTRLVHALFPRLKNTHYGSDWDMIWSRDQRVCSHHSFQKYFSYGIPPGDISDVDVSKVLMLGSEGDAAAFGEMLQRYESPRAMEKILQKLRQVEDEIHIDPGQNLALCFAPHGEKLPRDTGMMALDLNFMAPAIYASKIAARIDRSSDRVAFLKKLIEIAEPLHFAFEIFRWARKSDDQKEEERILSEEEEQSIASLLIRRIRDAAGVNPIYRTFGGDVRGLLWVWKKYGNAAEVSVYLENSLNSGISEVDNFLDAFVGTSWGLESGLSRKSDLDRSNYDTISGLLDPNLVLSRLRERYGPVLDEPDYHPSSGVPVGERLARQFAYLHGKVSAKAKETPGAPLDAKGTADSGSGE